jgi:hypothetical protein
MMVWSQYANVAVINHLITTSHPSLDDIGLMAS